MKKQKALHVLFIFCLVLSLVFSLNINKVYASQKNEVTLNFDGGIIHDGYVEYSGLGKVQLFKGNDLVANISNNMTIDLNEADYELNVTGENLSQEPGTYLREKVVASVNDWWYALTNNQVIIKLDTNEFSGNVNIKLIKNSGVHINTRVEDVYTNTSSTGTLDFTNSKTYTIDFSKEDKLTNGLKIFAELDKTLYYKSVNGSLLKTDDESEAIFKIVGNVDEMKATIELLNTNGKKEESFKGVYTAYTGSKLQFDGSIEEIINETRTDYYTICTYNFVFKYKNDNAEEQIPEEKNTYKFIEGANQVYTLGESDNATFRIDAEYSLFEGKVYVDGTLLDNTNYDSKSGSTIIILKNEYLKTLSTGKHTLKVLFAGGKETVTEFEINQNANTNGVSNPQTGDEVITYFVFLAISAIGIITIAAINSKKSKNENKF